MQQMGYGASGGSSGEEKQPSYMMVCQNWLLISWLINSSIKHRCIYRYVTGLESICWHIHDLDQVKQHTAAWIAANIQEAHKA